MGSADGQQDHLNGHSGFILAVFCVVSALVIWPLKIPLPGYLQSLVLSTLLKTRIIGRHEFTALSTRCLHFHLSLTTAPVIAVILLLATTTIHGSTIRLGIVGDENVKPYDVLVLFISLAYISIALDGTGALEATAFYVSKRGGSSGRLLFTYLYAFFLLTACIVGNDPLILSGTPFLAYLSQHTGLDPTAWIFAEFMAANTASAVLVSSNPTNILITGSFGLNYLTGFTKWTVLPSLIPAVLNYPILLGMFWKKIPRTLTPLTDDPWSKLRDKTGAVFLSALMLITVAVLVGTSFVPGHAVEVWMVTAPAGVIAFLYNVVTDWIYPETGRNIGESAAEGATDIEVETETAMEIRTIDCTTPRPTRALASSTNQPPDPEKGSLSTPESNTSHSRSPTPPARDDVNAETKCQNEVNPSPSRQHSTSPSPSPQIPSKDESPNTAAMASTRSTPSSASPATLTSLIFALAARFPRTTHTLRLLPIPLLPFAMCEFILVRGLAQRGWIRVFATGFSRACTSPAATVFFFSFVSAAFLCPLAGTNIGATIILVEIMRHERFMGSAHVRRDPRIMAAAVYAVAMGSNIGAFAYTFAGSLAGLLWRELLAEKGVVVGQGRFAKVNALPLLMQIVVSAAVVLAEVYWWVS
ncbi:arsenical pump membrane protein [Cladophialophora carrionii]|uniref:Arsenical pump membrane protein n=1 Tax=Cladophialophora carrionii TaxID=86049 RepID=A0A1C1CG23_9EURO|nr:arsenical pump membrane protein [Cladophialophora carrionii]